MPSQSRQLVTFHRISTVKSGRHRFGSTAQSVSAAFADAPLQTYQVFGTPSDRDAGRLAIGANWHANARTTVYAKLGAQAGSHTRNYEATAGAQWKW